MYIFLYSKSSHKPIAAEKIIFSQAYIFVFCNEHLAFIISPIHPAADRELTGLKRSTNGSGIEKDGSFNLQAVFAPRTTSLTKTLLYRSCRSLAFAESIARRSGRLLSATDHLGLSYQRQYGFVAGGLVKFADRRRTARRRCQSDDSWHYLQGKLPAHAQQPCAGLGRGTPRLRDRGACHRPRSPRRPACGANTASSWFRLASCRAREADPCGAKPSM